MIAYIVWDRDGNIVGVWTHIAPARSACLKGEGRVLQKVQVNTWSR